MSQPSTADRLIAHIRHAQTIVDNDPDRTLRESARAWINQLADTPVPPALHPRSRP